MVSAERFLLLMIVSDLTKALTRVDYSYRVTSLDAILASSINHGLSHLLRQEAGDFIPVFFGEVLGFNQQRFSTEILDALPHRGR